MALIYVRDGMRSGLFMVDLANQMRHSHETQRDLGTA